MSEYKEFWIQASNMIAHDDKPPIAKQLFHVIEYEAFENLCREMVQVKHLANTWFDENKKLKKQNEIMREALEFYADGDSWNHIEPGTHHVTNIYQCIDKQDYGDGDFTISERMNIDDSGVGGKRAREALKDVEGVG